MADFKKMIKVLFLGFKQNRFASALSAVRKLEQNLNKIGDQSDYRVEIIC